MLEPILGSISKERVLVYLLAREQGYAREVARFFSASVSPIQKQMAALEAQNVLYSEDVGGTRVYKINPRYPFLTELTNLLNKAITFYPPKQQEQLLMNRRRPRRAGKPL
jgi:hypothetical protein